MASMTLFRKNSLNRKRRTKRRKRREQRIEAEETQRFINAALNRAQIHRVKDEEERVVPRALHRMLFRRAQRGK